MMEWTLYDLLFLTVFYLRYKHPGKYFLMITLKKKFIENALAIKSCRVIKKQKRNTSYNLWFKLVLWMYLTSGICNLLCNEAQI